MDAEVQLPQQLRSNNVSITTSGTSIIGVFCSTLRSCSKHPSKYYAVTTPTSDSKKRARRRSIQDELVAVEATGSQPGSGKRSSGTAWMYRSWSGSANRRLMHVENAGRCGRQI